MKVFLVLWFSASKRDRFWCLFVDIIVWFSSILDCSKKVCSINIKKVDLPIPGRDPTMINCPSSKLNESNLYDWIGIVLISRSWYSFESWFNAGMIRSIDVITSIFYWNHSIYYCYFVKLKTTSYSNWMEERAFICSEIHYYLWKLRTFGKCNW